MGFGKRSTGVAGAVFAVMAVIGSGSAYGAASHPAEAMTQWQQAISHPTVMPRGCYQASYPSLQWQAAACQIAPVVPMSPAAVGNGKDYSAVVSGTISRATGSFDGVSPTLTERGQYGATGSKIANTYSLQLNTQFFSTPTCSGSSKPANCLGWQQFVYDSHGEWVFMQYWLINYSATCPAGWNTYSSDCYMNSPLMRFAGGRIAVHSLGTTKLAGSATAGGVDEVSLSSGGKATMVSNGDNVLDLSASWNTAEFDLFGDGGGGEAYFGTGTTLEAKTTLRASSTAAPKCVKEGFTAETNNLNLTHTPAIGAQTSPTMVSEQTNAGASSASCAVAAG
jgi:hypothetical protein